MSGRGNVVEWVERTEEVIVTEGGLPPDSSHSAVLPLLEPTETPIQKLLDTMVQGEDPEVDNGFYCEECQSLFQDLSDHNGITGPSFILDSPTTMGVPQRALLTLPHGLMIGRSSIPNAGLGVINQGPTVTPGMHFGPYEGEVTTKENALSSDFSWEIYKGKDEYEYIDAARESYSNWMRYVNCARNEDEKNLLAVQYKDSVLFHCCRTIYPGDELMVWPSSKLLTRLSDAWSHIWCLKLTPAESNTAVASQIFLCAHCQLSFTTEAYLQRHTEFFHSQPNEESATPGIEAMGLGNAPLPADTEHPAASLVVLTVDPFESKTCSECGKVFKHTHHLKRHKLCVHSNKRPYCCPECRRSFSQASGLLRHQLVHKKRVLIKETDAVLSRNKTLGEKSVASPSGSELTRNEEPTGNEEVSVSEELSWGETQVQPDKPTETENDPAEETETTQRELDKQSKTCSECKKSFTNECYLKKHKLIVHANLRPYACKLCRKCFGQHSDLSRHLKCHRGKRKKGRTVFCCAKCSQTFSSEKSLQQHEGLNHSEEPPEVPPVEEPEGSPDTLDGNQGHDPDFIAQPSVAKVAESIQRPSSPRPQRLGARSKISAITKLIAPKKRGRVSKKVVTSPAQSEECVNETQTEGCLIKIEVDDDGESTEMNGKSAKQRRYSCSCCNRVDGKEDLKAHKCSARQHSCIHCGATFKKPGFLKRHERMLHANAKNYSCDRCGKAFSKPANLKQHQKAKSCEKHHCTSELFPCPFCLFSFTMKSYLRKHIRRHHPVEFLSQMESDNQMSNLEEREEEKAHVCPHCGKSYVSAKHFKAHTCFQQVKILYLCTDCGKGFTNHYGLKQHQRIHTGEKPYSCPHCAKSFSYTGQLNVHIRTHTGEKPYLCTHCGESFRQSGDLKRHERKHTGVRPHSCPDCLKSFSRPHSLKAHQMLHLGQKMFKCTQCGKSFSRNYHLRRHHLKMHS